MKAKLANETIKSNYGARLLELRGVKSVPEFLNPGPEALQSWEDLKNINEGADLVASLAPGAKIALVVDCDVDGYTSAAIIGQYLNEIGSFNIQYYLHKGKQHGLEEHWEEIAEAGPDLVILPDAGSNDGEYAGHINCPILVIDHHIVEDSDPEPNMVIINNQTSPDYRNKDLSGAGMAYQFCRALDARLGHQFSEKYIDLAALGVCGDMMSGLEIENQYIWKQGFSNIENYFFLTIARKQAFSITGQAGASDSEIIEALNPTTVAFYIVPLINAMVRVGTQEEKERMLLAFIDGHKKIPSKKRGAKGTLEEVAVESVRECVNARALQNRTKENVVARLTQKIHKYSLLENKILFIRLDEEDNLPSELTGLVAMQLSQQYKRPTIVARLNEQGYVRGSIRGLSNSAIASFKDYLDSTGLFEYVQGHDNAAGCSIKNSNLDSLHQRANSDFAQHSLEESCYEVEFERQALDPDLEELISDLFSYKAIWSQHNKEPLIYVKDLHFQKKDVQILGRNKDTLKIMKNGIAYMKFFAKDLIKEIDLIQGEEIKAEVVGKANINHWGATTTPQIFIEHMEIKEDNLLDF